MSNHRRSSSITAHHTSSSSSSSTSRQKQNNSSQQQPQRHLDNTPSSSSSLEFFSLTNSQESESESEGTATTMSDIPEEECPKPYSRTDYYNLGTQVTSNEIVYECIEWSCSSDGYEPGTGWKWDQAWKMIGSCGGEKIEAGEVGVDTSEPTLSPMRSVSEVPSAMPSKTGDDNTPPTTPSNPSSSSNSSSSNNINPSKSPTPIKNSIPTSVNIPRPPSDFDSPLTTYPPCPHSDCCGSQSVQFTDYRGTVSTARNGYECQPWHSPHVTEIWWPNMFPNAGLEDTNACRNPNDDPRGVWCFTLDPKKESESGVEYCDVPVCSGGVVVRWEGVGLVLPLVWIVIVFGWWR